MLYYIPDNVQKYFDINATFDEIVDGAEEQDLKKLSNNTINKIIQRVNKYLSYMIKLNYMKSLDLTIPKYPDDSKKEKHILMMKFKKLKKLSKILKKINLSQI